MKKNYEKIYKRLIKEIKRMKQDERNPNNYAHEDTEVMKAVEKRASQYAITVLNCVLEMSGKKLHRSIMSPIEFNKWKERIIE